MASLLESPAEGLELRAASLAFPVVGVGASAGGLEAFTELLRALPVDTGVAFVLVQHLAPTRESTLAEILSRATSMPVTTVADEPRVERNHVYVIPPDKDMVLVEGRLRLLPREDARRHHPIDRFFRSLAENQRELAIGVVLSGTATDGTLGLEEIKAEGGITFAQDDSAQHRGMPRSAVDSGCVDFVLSPKEIAGEIASIATHPYVAAPPAPASAPTHDTRLGAGASGADPGLAPGELTPILRLLRSATSLDFMQYRPATLARRIRRRMVLLKERKVRNYVRLLKEEPAEVEALYQDLLINVTSFFRDPRMFEVLAASVMPALLKDRDRSDPLRIWSLGCSTGEEAYSLAILASEALESSKSRASVQVFATDVNAKGIEHARAGVYSADRLRDVSRERLRRCFVETNGKFHVAKSIRETCVFSRHDALSDPPFSRMDLISCRNLLIYLEPGLQQRVLPIFHYALKPTGFLVLGASESIGPFRNLFEVEDGKHKVFSRKAVPGFLPHFRGPRAGSGTRSGARSGTLDKRQRSASWGEVLGTQAPGKASALEEADRLLARFAPPAVLVDGNLEIVQFRGDTEPFLVPAQGRASLALMKMVRPGLLVPLRALLRRAQKERAAVREERVRFRSAGGHRALDLEVVPVTGKEGEEASFLVLFKPVDAARAKVIEPDRRSRTRSRRAAKESRKEAMARLEQELAESREHLQALTEQYDATTDELQSANEEAQSGNEELQSINEELETTKEEIQSSNEELTTVNDELNNRNQELARLNGDLANLISSVHIAVVMVGRDLCIRRHSPLAEKLLRLIPADLGRPITDIRMGLVLPELSALLSEVIDTVSIREREVQGSDGRWYSLRIRPYLTFDNEVDGAVMMWLDVDAIRRSREYAESIVATVREPLVVLDDELRVRSASRAFYENFVGTREETVGRPLCELGTGQWDGPELRSLLESIRAGAPAFDDFEVEAEFEGIGRRTMQLNARRFVIPGEERSSILLAVEDVTEHSRAEAALRRSETRYRRLFESAKDGILILDGRSAQITDANPYLCQLLGYSRTELLGKELWQIGLFHDVEQHKSMVRVLQEEQYIRYENLPLENKSGEKIEVEFVSNLYVEGDHAVIQCNIRDITEHRRAERSLRETQQRLASLVEYSDDAILSASLDGVIQTWNAAAERLFGYTVGQAVGRPVSLLLPPERAQDFLRSLASIQAGEHVDHFETQRLRSDGQIVEISLTASPIRDAAGRIIGVSKIARDITERKRMEEELRVRNQQLFAADSAKTQFIAVLAHELRQPLTAICGWMQILTRPEASRDDFRRGLEVIDRNSKAQARLIEDLMDAHRIAAGKIRLDVLEVDLRGLVETVLEALVPQAEEKEIDVAREIETGAFHVAGDFVRLQQALGNVLGNALKFTPKGGAVRVALCRARRHAEIRVSDSGPGISAESLPLVFDRFAQGDPLTSRDQGGLGLGLAVAKQLVELHGGAISASSPGRGKGATFTLSLPLLSTQRSLQPAVNRNATAAGGPRAASLNGILVLVVDDEPDAREPIRRVLEEAGAETIAVASVDEALEAIRQRRPHVILSDIGMPGRDGYDLMRSLDSGLAEPIPAIALTSYAEEKDRDRALSSGFQAHLAKPVALETLISTVAELALGGWPAGR